MVDRLPRHLHVRLTLVTRCLRYRSQSERSY
jgi:hypothetical protein